jgi:serine/threonine protein kinase
VWSFGMVLYELIVMKQPYFDKNHFEISTCNVKGIRPTVPESVDKEAFKELLKLFNKCTNKKPQDRPSTADILATLAAM